MNKKMITLILTLVIVVVTALVNFFDGVSNVVNPVGIDSTKTADSSGMDSTIVVPDSIAVVDSTKTK